MQRYIFKDVDTFSKNMFYASAYRCSPSSPPAGNGGPWLGLCHSLVVVLFPARRKSALLQKEADGGWGYVYHSCAGGVRRRCGGGPSHRRGRRGRRAGGRPALPRRTRRPRARRRRRVREFSVCLCDYRDALTTSSRLARRVEPADPARRAPSFFRVFQTGK